MFSISFLYKAIGQANMAKLKELEYKSIEVSSLSIEEMLGIGIPDRYWGTVRAGFSSPAGREYLAVHVREHPEGPYILLVSDTRMDAADFLGIGEAVKRITEGEQDYRGGEEMQGFLEDCFKKSRYDQRITNRSGDLCEVIRLKRKPDREYLAELVEKYDKVFTGVHIEKIFFSDVPVSVYWASELPAFSKDKVHVDPV